MRLVIAADVYPPEISSAAVLMRQLAETLVHRGHDVTVITSRPRHYLATAESGNAIPPVRIENGVRVVRAAVLPHHKVNFIVRGIAQLLLPFLFFRAFRRMVQGPVDGVFVYSPPLPLGLFGRWVKRRTGARFVLNLQDIFPQNAIDLGVLKNALIIRGFEKLEHYLYRAADAITFHSEGGKRFLVARKGIPTEKITVVPNWVDLSDRPTPVRPQSFRAEYGLEGKFIFLFGGIMGPAQRLEFLLEVAAKLRDIPEVAFLLVGDGMEAVRLREIVRERGLANVAMHSFVPSDEYPALVAEADVGVVCLSIHNHTPFIPGKFLGYLTAGKPILALLNKESDGFDLVRESGCGYAIASDDADAAASLIREIFRDRHALAAKGANGRRYAERHLSVETCAATVESLLATPR